MATESKAPGEADGIYQISGGLATFGPEMLAIREALEQRILAWAAEIGARPMLFPPLIRARDLSRFDYFLNFPHLAVVASRIRSEVLAERYAKGGDVDAIPPDDLSAGRYVLPSAACYNVYLHFEGAVLDAPCYITTVATCFRNENAYDELQRLWSFSMREIVCLGPAEAVKEHLRSFKERISSFAAEIGLSLGTQFATDPFYQPQSSTARMQKLFPQKEEFVYGGELAIASLNFHRNFFGERCNICMTDGAPVFSGCVAFGLERWFHALLDRYQHNPERVLEALAL
jgi:seryl-tRNA synthetase